MGRTRQAAALVVIALASCSDATDERLDTPAAGPSHPATEPARPAAAAKRAAASVPSRTVVDPPVADAVARAIAGSETGTAETLVEELRASGVPVADALVAWLLGDDALRRTAADAALDLLGLDGVRALARAIGSAGPEGVERILERFEWRTSLWAASDAAREIAAAAWAVATDEEGSPRRTAILVATAPGALMRDLAPDLLAALRGPRGTEWLDALAEDDVRDGAARVLEADAARVAAFLDAAEDAVREDAARLLSAMVEAPEPVRDALIRAAASADAPSARFAASVVASWGETDATCAAAVRDLLTTASPEARIAILDAWRVDLRAHAADTISFASLLTHADDDLRLAAESLVERTFDELGDLGLGPALRQALERGDGESSTAICRLIELWGHATIDYDADRYPADELAADLVRLASDRRPDVALAALRALGSASWDMRATAETVALDRLDDPIPGVRAWALYYAAHAEEPDTARIAAAAKSVLDVLDSFPEVDAAFSALRWTDPRAAFLVSRRWVDSGDEGLERLARCAQTDAAADTLTTADLSALLAKLPAWKIDRDELRALLATAEGRPAVIRWLAERFGNDEIASKAEILELIVRADDRGQDLVEVVERLRADPAHRRDADVALAALTDDDAEALRRLDATLEAGGDPDIADWRLLDLGAEGAALFVRHYDPGDTIDSGAYIFGREPEAVAGAIARQASDPSSHRRARAARWTSVLPEAAAFATLRRLAADDDVLVATVDAAIDRRGVSAQGRSETAQWAVRLVRDEPEEFPVARSIAYLANSAPLPDGATDALRAASQRFAGVAGSAASVVLAIHGSSDARVVAAVNDIVGTPRDDSIPGCDIDALAAQAIVALGPAAEPCARAVARRLGAATDPTWFDAAAALAPSSPEIVATLRARLRWTDDVRRLPDDAARAAIRALGAAGRAATAAVPDLRVLARRAALRDDAQAAIARIEGAR